MAFREYRVGVICIGVVFASAIALTILFPTMELAQVPATQYAKEKEKLYGPETARSFGGNRRSVWQASRRCRAIAPIQATQNSQPRNFSPTIVFAAGDLDKVRYLARLAPGVEGATVFLRQQLESGPQVCTDLISAAEKEGFSRSSLYRARGRLG